MFWSTLVFFGTSMGMVNICTRAPRKIGALTAANKEWTDPCGNVTYEVPARHPTLSLWNIPCVICRYYTLPEEPKGRNSNRKRRTQSSLLRNALSPVRKQLPLRSGSLRFRTGERLQFDEITNIFDRNQWHLCWQSAGRKVIIYLHFVLEPWDISCILSSV